MAMLSEPSRRIVVAASRPERGVTAPGGDAVGGAGAGAGWIGCGAGGSRGVGALGMVEGDTDAPQPFAAAGGASLTGGGVVGGNLGAGGAVTVGDGGPPTLCSRCSGRKGRGGASARLGCIASSCVACGCAKVVETGSVNFVGAGKGNFILETTYMYVGQGQGDTAPVTPRTYLFGRIALVVGVLLVVVFFVAFGPSSVTTSNLQSSGMVGQFGECTFWGDPHVFTFDRSRPSFYGDGEQWIIKHQEVKIQGRYMGTRYTKGLAATNKIIVSGSFVGGHKITVGTMDSGDLDVDGQHVFVSFPSKYVLPNDLGEITYDSQGVLVDQATQIWDKKIVTMRLPKDITITVFRWKNYLDLRIEMPALTGIDGACGNFNGNPDDDTTEAIYQRIGARVGRGENLFHRRAQVNFTETEEGLLKMCSPERYSNGEVACQAELAGLTMGEDQFKSCMLDHCFGANQHALKLAKSLGM